MSADSAVQYQWQFMGTNLLGATNQSLSLTNVQPADAGSYRVIVSNSSGSSTSAVAWLTILPAPKVAFVAQAGSSGTNAGNAIAVDDAGNAYVTGLFTNTLVLGSNTLTSAGLYDAFLASYDRKGQVRWAKRVGGSSDDAGTGVEVDPFGNICFSGSATGLTEFDSVPWTNGAGSVSYMAKSHGQRFTALGAHESGSSPLHV